jgi:carbonic anhydrase
MESTEFSLDLDSDTKEHSNRVKDSLNNFSEEVKSRIKELEHNSEDENEEESETEFIKSKANIEERPTTMSQSEIEEELLKSVQTIKGIAGSFDDIIQHDEKVILLFIFFLFFCFFICIRI